MILSGRVVKGLIMVIMQYILNYYLHPGHAHGDIMFGSVY